MTKIWHKLFLEERPSVGLSFFRIFAALTVGFHVLPTFCHLADNYFPTAFKTLNDNFFTLEVLDLVQQSPSWLIVTFVWIFCVFWFFFLIGLWSRLSCIVMTLACYYFYALNSLHVGTLSWDILLVVLFLMCVSSYHGDYFSLDCLRKGREDSYKTLRPFFVQRLLQIQIAATYFYTALYKITAQGNWLTGNPMYYLMNYPSEGIVKNFILRDYLMNQPALCYWIGISIVTIEILMPFLLFYRKTRFSAIYLGFFFHVILILTFDVPAIFFFLFPPQLLLFIPPESIGHFIEQRRLFNQARKQKYPFTLVYDGNCQFCLASIQKLKVMDLFSALSYVDLHTIEDFKDLHSELSKEKALSRLHLIMPGDRIHKGFGVFRRLSLLLPMLYPLSLLFYFPAMSLAGEFFYQLVAKNRYLFHFSRRCKDNACFRH